MTRLVIPGGWYGEAWPSGEYAVALAHQQAVQTHQGRIDLTRDLLYVRMTTVGGFRFAGQDWGGAGNLEYVTSLNRVGDSFSVSPLIYLHDGSLRQVAVGESHQGWRFEDEAGKVWTGDETYNDPVTHLSEWTTLGGVQFGQGQTEAASAVVQIDGKKRQLEPGFCYALRVQQQGDLYAIAIAKFQEAKTVLIWATLAELAALPEMPVIEPPPPDHGGGGSGSGDGGNNGGGGGSHEPPHEQPPVGLPPVEGAALMADVNGIIYAKHINSRPDGRETYNLPNGNVFSCQPDGSVQERPAGTDGQWELGQRSGNIAAFHPVDDKYYSFAVVLVDKL